MADGDGGIAALGVPAGGAGEPRVATVPGRVGALRSLGLRVVVETGAGAGAGFTDDDYRDAGATVTADAAAVWGSEVVACVSAPAVDRAALLGRGSVLVGMLDVLRRGDLVRALVARGATAIAMEKVPRVSRAQSIDALSSQATVAGYWAVVAAAGRLPRMFPLLMTAAGTVPPARVLVIGAGVAGLQAVATARRLGAVVTAFDVRADAAEQVESLGARFLALERPADADGGGGYARELSEEEQSAERHMLADAVAASDVVVTTAMVPEGPAPVLVSPDAVARMRHGSVVVDLAAAAGGNCPLTEPGREAVTPGGVRLIGPLLPAAEMPEAASALYARNIEALLALLVRDGRVSVDTADEVVGGATVIEDGRVRHPWLIERLEREAAA